MEVIPLGESMPPSQGAYFKMEIPTREVAYCGLDLQLKDTLEPRMVWLNG